jgi:hypothetical protein
MRMPDATRTFLTPGTSRTFFISSFRGPWSTPSSLQIGRVHARQRRHFASTSGFEQRIWYMFAVGPPTSLMWPLKSGSFGHLLQLPSGSTAGCGSGSRAPGASVIEQNVQPPKQPRIVVTESLIIVCAGIGARSVGCGRARVGQVVDAVHAALVEREAGGLTTSRRSPCFCSRRRPFCGLVSWCSSRVAVRTRPCRW